MAATGEHEGSLSGSIGTVGVRLISALSNEHLPDEDCGGDAEESS